MGENVLLVTGGERGIGAAVCRAAASRGYRVTANYRSAAAGSTPVGEIATAGGDAVAIAADVAREEEVERLFGETEARPFRHITSADRSRPRLRNASRS